MELLFARAMDLLLSTPATAPLRRSACLLTRALDDVINETCDRTSSFDYRRFYRSLKSPVHVNGPDQ